MKLYIWHAVLNDCGAGNITVMANSEAEARAIVAKESDSYAEEIANSAPAVHSEPFALYNHGSA